MANKSDHQNGIPYHLLVNIGMIVICTVKVYLRIIMITVCIGRHHQLGPYILYSSDDNHYDLPLVVCLLL